MSQLFYKDTGLVTSDAKTGQNNGLFVRYNYVYSRWKNRRPRRVFVN